MDGPRVLFVNAGILGLVSFHQFLLATLPTQSYIRGELLLLPEQTSLFDRVIRRLITQRLWKDGWFGLANVDLARFRYEMNAGLHARRRITALGPSRFDVLHFHRQATAYGSLDLMRRIPSIVSIDCTQECVIQGASSGIERATYELNVRRDGEVFRRAVAIISTSRWAAGTLRRQYPDCTTPVHVLPNPVLLDHFDSSWMAARAARAAQGAKPRALFMGGDFPRKGGYELLDAWERGRLHEIGMLRVVTDWQIERALPRGVELTGGIRAHTPEWARCWADADVFVMPTRNEAFGLVFQEAAAAGLPAVGPAHNAIPEIIQDGETGLLVPLRNEAALVDALRRLLVSADLRHRLGARARQVIEATTDPQQYMAELSGIIAAARMR